MDLPPMIAEALHAYSGRRVFVTGHTGFKGAWLCVWLDRLGARTTGYALPPESRSLFLQARIAERIDSREGDVRDLECVRAAVREAQPEIVFHMAAQSLVRLSYETPVETFATNVMGTAHLLEAVREVPSVRSVVIVTSDKCYENDGRAEPFIESAALGGHDPYSASKGCAELVTAAYARSFFADSQCTVVSARAGNVIGGGDWAVDRIVPDLARAAESGIPAVIRQPKAVRPWQHVLEPLGGYLLLAHRAADEGQRLAGPWNFGPALEDGVAVRDLVEQLRHCWPEVEVNYRADESGLHEAAVLRLDCSKARTQLGWRPVLGLDRTLDMTASWYREAASGSAAEITDRQIAEYEQLLMKQEELCR
ncbi:MAG: CDP-glucose 4,6-dehydratase [Sphingomicrobium sp.]